MRRNKKKKKSKWRFSVSFAFGNLTVPMTRRSGNLDNYVTPISMKALGRG